MRTHRMATDRIKAAHDHTQASHGGTAACCARNSSHPPRRQYLGWTRCGRAQHPQVRGMHGAVAQGRDEVNPLGFSLTECRGCAPT